MLENIRKIKIEICDNIDDIVRDHKCSYIDATLHYCETNNIDLEQVGSLLQSNAAMTAKIEGEATTLNFLKK